MDSYLRDIQWRHLIVFLFEKKEYEESELRLAMKGFEHLEGEELEQAIRRRIFQIKQSKAQEAALTEEDLEKELHRIQKEREQERKVLDESLKQFEINALVEEYNKIMDEANTNLSVLEECGLCEHENYNLNAMNEALSSIKLAMDSELTAERFCDIKCIPLTARLDWVEENLEKELEALNQLNDKLGKAFLDSRQRIGEDKENVGYATNLKRQVEKITKMLHHLISVCQKKVPQVLGEWEETLKEATADYEKIQIILNGNRKVLEQEIERIRKGFILPPAPTVQVTKTKVPLDAGYARLEQAYGGFNEAAAQLNSVIQKHWEGYESSRPEMLEQETRVRARLDLLADVSKAQHTFSSERFKDMLARAKQAKLL